MGGSYSEAASITPRAVSCSITISTKRICGYPSYRGIRSSVGGRNVRVRYSDGLGVRLNWCNLGRQGDLALAMPSKGKATSSDY